jgi:hypothetical protein
MVDVLVVLLLFYAFDFVPHFGLSCCVYSLIFCVFLFCRYNNRTSSAHWDADQLTLVEKRSYRKHMGYDRGAAPTATA